MVTTTPPDIAKTAATQTAVISTELGITDISKKAKLYDLLVALIVMERGKERDDA